jgi:hypothetical protein
MEKHTWTGTGTRTNAKDTENIVVSTKLIPCRNIKPLQSTQTENKQHVQEHPKSNAKTNRWFKMDAIEQIQSRPLSISLRSMIYRAHNSERETAPTWSARGRLGFSSSSNASVHPDLHKAQANLSSPESLGLKTLHSLTRAQRLIL